MRGVGCLKLERKGKRSGRVVDMGRRWLDDCNSNIRPSTLAKVTDITLRFKIIASCTSYTLF